MNRIVGFALGSLALICAKAGCEPPAAPEPIQTIQLPGVNSHFDHFGIDPEGGRLFATLQTENIVHVYQLNTGNELGKISGIGKPHAVLFRRDIDRLFITDGNHDHGIVHVVDGKTFAVLKDINLAPGAEQYSYDPATKYMYVGNGGHDAAQPYSFISVIDTTHGKKIADIRVDTPNLEATTLEKNGDLLFANDRLNGRVIVVDRKRRRVLTTWPITGAKLNVAMALDEAHHRLFAGCRSGAIAVFDTGSGRQVATLPIGEDVDDLMYDPVTNRIFAPTGGGDGALNVYREGDPDHYTREVSVTTGPGGKNGIYVPSVHRYYVGVPQHGNTDDQILVYDIQ